MPRFMLTKKALSDLLEIGCYLYAGMMTFCWYFSAERNSIIRQQLSTQKMILWGKGAFSDFGK
jgi:hypothetical protein